MAVSEINSEKEFDHALASSSGALTVIHFFAPWAPECTQMNDVLSELAKDNIHVKFIKIEAENFPEISLKYDINAVPSFILLKNQKLVDRLDGANAPELSKKVQYHANIVIPPDMSQKSEKEDLDTRLKKLTHSAPCILFMKGTPQEPRCGFSRQVIEILNSTGIKFSSFDILSDDEVRQGLKKFSNWPTYPQIYINGELIGGLDILKEMRESGELSTVLPKPAENINDRLASLLKSAPVLIFMKGNPEAPQCGFSKQLCGILNSYKSRVKYSSFDILQDQEVRDGLKKYSDWPTYPQLYVNGELIGGLDIIRELHENGELEATLSGSQSS